MAPSQPLALFMTVDDLYAPPWGMLTPHGSTLTPMSGPELQSPHRLYDGLWASSDDSAAEVFALASGANGLALSRCAPSAANVSAWPCRVLVDLDGFGEVALARRPGEPDSGPRYMLLAFRGGAHAYGFTSADGEVWEPIVRSGPADGGSHCNADKNCLFDDHDAVGLIHHQGQWVDVQGVLQPYAKRFPDSVCLNVSAASCVRRVLGVRAGGDGGRQWRAVSGLRTPDVGGDPPELEFYRLRPFAYFDRALGCTLNYAASPKATNPRQIPQPRGQSMHGPAINSEWWLLPRNESILNVTRWRRLYAWAGGAGAAPPGVDGVRHAPLAHNRSLLWLSAGRWFGLPEWRVGGLRAPANAELESRPFTLPNSTDRPLHINIDCSWGLPGPPSSAVASCDADYEWCQPYAMVSLVDGGAPAGAPPLEGYEPERCVLQNVGGTRVPLRWRPPPPSSAPAVDSTPLAGRSVRVRVLMRHATLYAVGA